jgi:ABC-type nitrate/sulfonate/bicarbonate transport system permease component
MTSFFGRQSVQGVLAVTIACLLWEALSHSGMVDRLLAPPLESIAQAFVRDVYNGKLVLHAEWTLFRLFLGLALAVCAGIILGAGMALSGRLEEFLEPVFSFGYPIPKIALYPIIAFLLGLGSGPKIAIVCLESLYPIAINVYAGLKNVPRSDIDAARTMGASRFQIFYKVLAFRAAPSFFSSLRIAAHVALATTIILEMIGDSTGLGFYITYTAASFDFNASFAAVFTTVLIGFLLDRSLIMLQRAAVYWEKAFGSNAVVV